MIGRLIIVLVALHLVVTSAFAHGMSMPEHCADPSAQRMHGEETSYAQDQGAEVTFASEEKSKPLGLLHCASVACTDQFAGNAVPALVKAPRSADLNPAEPQMALQSVFLSQLRPPLV
ncbi:hypothetical protein G5B38_04710 [Pseudohalocynthiibacter aestuariivivens]|nr:hypothetical protein [Pseudohalocynthiibacter aestuariivivens]QIE44882.1 hypothetical protein G5B38_04710 [Pseudohalocynthiibacter aestuariivivens]